MKVQVTMSDEMITRLDACCGKLGVTRSSLCAMFIGQGVVSFEKSMDMIADMGNKIGDSLVYERTLENYTEGNNLRHAKAKSKRKTE